MTFTVGTRVAVTHSGKVAVKKDGKLTGEWIAFNKNEIGTVVNIKRAGRGRPKPVYAVELAGGTVEMLGQHIVRLGGEPDL